MQRILNWNLVWILGTGALVEIIVLLSILPENSIQPPTALQAVLDYTQVPGGLMFSILFGTGLGHWLDTLPAPLAAIIFWVGAGAVFLFQSAFMGVVLWLPVRTWRARRIIRPQQS